MNISGSIFEGPHLDTASIPSQAGVYCIMDKRNDGKWYVLDVGESRDLKSRIADHDRGPCWSKHRRGTIAVWVHVMLGSSGESRRLLEHRIRAEFTPVCGVV